MNRAPRLHAVALVTALLVAVLAAPCAARDTGVQAGLDALLRPLEPFSRTGVLLNRVLPLAHLEQLDGGAGAPVTDAARWRQAYDELQRAALAPGADPDLAAIEAGARAAARDGTVPLALIDAPTNACGPDRSRTGSLAVRGGSLEPGTASPLEATRAVVAAALVPRTYHGADVTFTLDASRCFGDERAKLRSLAIDFADGRGERPVAPGERVRVHYAATGLRTLRLRLEHARRFAGRGALFLDVAALAAPAPDDTLHVTASVPWHGQYGTGNAYVYLAPGHAALVNPVIVAEGFDTDNVMGWDELYALLDQQGLIETLRADGFDAVVLDFTDATDAIEKNGFVVEELLRRVQDAIAPTTSVALVGASMGGLCTRYALAWMETHAVPHRVRTWISFDTPHRGADIPLGLQYWIQFFSGQSASAASFLATLQRPAAREMLLHHLTTPAGTTGQPDPMTDSLAASFAAVGNRPSLVRRVAIANGSRNALGQGFAAGDQLIRYEYSSFLVAITGNVWAVPNGTSHVVFNGSQRILFSTTSQNVTVSGTLPWDGAPGGWRPSMTQLDTTAAPYGDIIALYPAHAFVPTVSALALATPVDPFFDLGAVPDLPALTPFDAVLVPAADEERVSISPEAAAWLRQEIGRGVLAVPPAAATAGVWLAPPAPNPFGATTRLAFTLAHDGRATVRVFDVRGRAVRTLARGAFAAGTHALAWDGRDNHGATAGAGVYFVRLEADGVARTRRVVRLD